MLKQINLPLTIKVLIPTLFFLLAAAFFLFKAPEEVEAASPCGAQICYGSSWWNGNESYVTLELRTYDWESGFAISGSVRASQTGGSPCCASSQPDWDSGWYGSGTSFGLSCCKNITVYAQASGYNSFSHNYGCGLTGSNGFTIQVNIYLTRSYSYQYQYQYQTQYSYQYQYQTQYSYQYQYQTQYSYQYQTQCANSAPAVPNPTSPQSPLPGSTINTSTAILDWDAISAWGINCAGNNNHYRVYFGTSNPPTTQVATYSQASGITQHNLSSLSNGTYYWYIQAHNGALGSTNPVVWSFTVALPNFTISVTPGSRSVNQGECTSPNDFSVTITSVNTFSGTVTLSVNDLSSEGISTTFSPNPVSVPSGSSVGSLLAVCASLTTNPSIYPITVTGTSGSLVRSQNVNLEVTSRPPSPWIRTERGNVGSQSSINLSGQPVSGPSSPQRLNPNGPGSFAQWQGQSPSTGAHWDKTTSNDADSTYVHYIGCAGRLKESYNLTNPTFSGTINRVNMYFRYRLESSGIPTFGYGIRLGSNESRTAQILTSTTYALHSYLNVSRPGGGSWTINDLNSIEAFVDVDACENVRLTQVYVEVEFTPSSSTNSNADYLVVASRSISVGFTSAKGWLIENYPGGLTFPEPKTYETLFTRFASTVCPLTGTSGSLPNVKGIFVTSGSFNVSSGVGGGSCPGFSGSKEATVVFINGTLTISTNINTSSTGGRPLVLVARDGINVLAGVTRIDALLITDNDFDDNIGSSALIVNGGVMAATDGSGEVRLRRDLGAANANSPSEHFIFEPKYLYLLSGYLGESRAFYSEERP